MDKLNIISLDKKNDKKKNKLNRIENEEKQDERKNKDNNDSSLTKKNYLEINQEEIKLKLLKILFGEKSKNKIEEQKIYNIKEKNDKKIDDDESQKIFYETSFNFHKSRLPKIKFRNTKDIQAINNNKHNNEKEIKNKIIENETINGNLNENLNINKEKKKMKKVVKKKVKKKKKEKIKKEEKSENYESNIERGEEEVETSTQEERLSKSLQERKVYNKK